MIMKAWLAVTMLLSSINGTVEEQQNFPFPSVKACEQQKAEFLKQLLFSPVEKILEAKCEQGEVLK